MTPRQLRTSAIETKKRFAERLLLTLTQEPMKEEVSFAQRDLDEAERWLRQDDVDNRPAILDVVDMSIQLATVRLNKVNKLLEEYGPDVTVIG